VEVGAELFIGNLDPMVDEKTLYDTFSTFGTLIAAPKVSSLQFPDKMENSLQMFRSLVMITEYLVVLVSYLSIISILQTKL